MTTSTAATTTVWTPEAIRQPGMIRGVPTAGPILSIGGSKAYQFAKSGEFPVTVIRIGRRYLVQRAPPPQGRVGERIGLPRSMHAATGWVLPRASASTLLVVDAV